MLRIGDYNFPIEFLRINTRFVGEIQRNNKKRNIKSKQVRKKAYLERGVEKAN